MAKRDDKNQPSFEVFSVKDGPEEKSFFNRIGTAFRHKDGEGHTISLNALPVNDKNRSSDPQRAVG